MEATPVIGYVRIAPREGSRSRPGLDAQRAMVEAECERRGWRLLRVEEDVRSGRTLHRPGLAAALEACRSGEAAAIVVSRLDQQQYSLLDDDVLARAPRPPRCRGTRARLQPRRDGSPSRPLD